MEKEERKILEVVRASTRAGSSFRITLPGKVVEKLGLTKEESFVVFVLDKDKVVLEKLKHI